MVHDYGYLRIDDRQGWFPAVCSLAGLFLLVLLFGCNADDVDYQAASTRPAAPTTARPADWEAATVLFDELRIVPASVTTRQVGIGVIERDVLYQVWGGFTITGWKHTGDGVFCVYVGDDAMPETVRVRRGEIPAKGKMTVMQYNNVVAAWEVWRGFYSSD